MKNIYLFQPQYSVDSNGQKSYWLPYSSACIWAYAKTFPNITDNFNLKEVFFKREDHDSVLSRLDNPSICGFSCYMWNENYSLNLAKKIKQRWPKCKIVFGGAQTHSGYLTHDFIDSIVLGEGEHSFVRLLNDYLTNNSIETLYPKSRIDDLESMPNPYSSGVFDTIIKKYPDYTWATTFESNRGCPYACTFCDWGQITYSKVRKFSLEYVQETINWIVNNNVSYLVFADANFGMLKDRDLEIARMFAQTASKNKNCKLEAFNVQFAKNSSEVVFEIAQTLNLYMKGITFSMQSMNNDTLQIIKRDNMEINKLASMLKLSEQYKINSYSELILGLPLETLQSWKQGLGEILELGQHTNIDVWFTQMLVNSELASQESVKKFGIKTVRAKNYISIYNPNEDYGEENQEVAELVRETNTMTTREMVDAYMFAWLIIHFHINGYSQVLARYCRNFHNVSYKDFYDTLLNNVIDDPIIGKHYKEIWDITFNYLQTGEFEDHRLRGHNIRIISSDYLFEQRQSMINLSIQTANSFVSLNDDIVSLQQHFIFDSADDYPKRLSSAINIFNWTKEPVTYNVEGAYGPTSRYNFYQGRRKGLLKNNLTIV